MAPGSAASTARRDTAPPHTLVRAVGWVLLGVVAVGFLLGSWSRITAPFADSDEGINAAVWGANSRALRELGPVDSRLGGVRADGTKYATHPPLIVVEAAVAERVAGEHPWSTRAPAWLGALVSIGLLAAIARELTGDWLVGASAATAATGCHMLFVYGGMLDTMVTAFPFALGVTWVWLRQWLGRSTPRSGWVFALCVVTCLAGWQATFLVGLCGVAVAVRSRRDPRAAARAAWPYLAGVAVGTALTLTWAYWVYGSFSVLRDKLLRRSGSSESVSVGEMVGFQLPWLAQLLGLGLVAVVGCVVALRERRWRPLAALALVAVFGYALLMREGSGGHQYWNYWAMLPATIGFALAFRGLARAGHAWGVVALTAVTAVAALLVVGVNVSRPDEAGRLIALGQRPYDLLAAPDALAPGQTELHYVAEPYRIDDWVRYHRLAEPLPLLDRAQLEQLAATRPEDRVLVLGSCASPDPTGICGALTSAGRAADGTDPPPRLVPAAALLAELR